MTDYETEFQTALNHGRIYATVAQLREAPEGTPITDSEGRHWIRGFNDATERRWRRRKAPRLIWVRISGDQARCPSSEIPLPARYTAIEDFWTVAGSPTLVEGPPTPFPIGSIAGGCVGAIVGGCVGGALWDEADVATRRYWLGLGLTPVPADSFVAGSVGDTPDVSP